MARKVNVKSSKAIFSENSLHAPGKSRYCRHWVIPGMKALTTVTSPALVFMTFLLELNPGKWEILASFPCQ